MKKLIVMALCAVSCAAAIASTDVYNLKLSGKVPYVSNGIRNYKTQTMTGKLFLTWSDDGALEEARAELQNKTTKVIHYLDFTDSLYNLMGKTTKKIYKSVPTFVLVGADSEVECTKNEAHELIKNVALAGTGSLTYIKGTGCGYCGDATADCNKLNKVSGNFVGVLDCECPEDSSWDHTLEATQCGLVTDEDGKYVRSHYAAWWGSWTATYDKKATAAYEN